MRPRARTHSPAAWPLWLLVLAWICANSPHTATFAVIKWVEHGRTFSHQQRLTSDLARLLGHQEMPANEPTLAQAPKSPSKPATLAEAVLTKIELALEQTASFTTPPDLHSRWRIEAASFRGLGRLRPAHEPPRLSA